MILKNIEVLKASMREGNNSNQTINPMFEVKQQLHERSQKLEQLNEKSVKLQENAREFAKMAKQVREEQQTHRENFWSLFSF